MSVSHSPSSKPASWPKRGRGLGRGWPKAGRRRSAASQANAPRHTTTLRALRCSSSATVHGRHSSRSWGVGLLAGGAQRTAAAIHASFSRRPSPRCREGGWLARPARYMAAKSQSPDRSPVNTRPVRLPPWAAGARPRTRTRAAGSPKPGMGRPQYSSSAKRRTRTRAPSSRRARSGGQRPQAMTSRSSAAQAAASGEPAPVLPLVVVAVGAGADRLPPPRVVAVPGHGLVQARVEADPRLPPEPPDLVRGERVAAVVPEAVGDVLDQRLVAAGQVEDAPDDLEVRALVRAAGVVGLAGRALLEHGPDGPREVGGMDPVADLHPVAVHRQG